MTSCVFLLLAIIGTALGCVAGYVMGVRSGKVLGARELAEWQADQASLWQHQFAAALGDKVVVGGCSCPRCSRRRGVQPS